MRQLYGPEVDDEFIWVRVVGGEKRGRLFGQGKRSRFTKKTLSQMSTATTAASSQDLYSHDDVASIVSQKLAAQETRYKAEMDLKEKRYQAEMEELRRNDEYNKACIRRILEAMGTNPPSFDVMWFTFVKYFATYIHIVNYTLF
jgi:hypothetical protein